MIQERKPPLDRMRHSHAIALRREEILGKENLDLEVLCPRQGIPFLEIRRETLVDRLCVCAFGSGFQFIRKEARGTAAIAPSHHMGVVG